MTVLDWFKIFFAIVYVRVGVFAAQYVAARHIALYGTKSLAYWFKLAAVILAGATGLGLCGDLISFLSGDSDASDGYFVGTMVCLFFGVLALPVLGAITFLSFLLTRYFPGVFGRTD